MKHWLDMLNDIKIDLSKYDEDELNDIEKMKLKSNIKTKIHKKEVIILKK